MSFKLAKHIIKLADTFGVSRYGQINGTDYVLDSNGYHNRTYYIRDNDSTIISNNNPIGFYAIRYIMKLRDKAKEQYEIDKINERIERDTTNYLSKGSELQEALEDFKRINELRREIQRIVSKWSTKYQSIFSNQ